MKYAVVKIWGNAIVRILGRGIANFRAFCPVEFAWNVWTEPKFPRQARALVASAAVCDYLWYPRLRCDEIFKMVTRWPMLDGYLETVMLCDVMRGSVGCLRMGLNPWFIANQTGSVLPRDGCLGPSNAGILEFSLLWMLGRNPKQGSLPRCRLYCAVLLLGVAWVFRMGRRCMFIRLVSFRPLDTHPESCCNVPNTIPEVTGNPPNFWLRESSRHRKRRTPNKSHFDALRILSLPFALTSIWLHDCPIARGELSNGTVRRNIYRWGFIFIFHGFALAVYHLYLFSPSSSHSYHFHAQNKYDISPDIFLNLILSNWF